MVLRFLKHNWQKTIGLILLIFIGRYFYETFKGEDWSTVLVEVELWQMIYIVLISLIVMASRSLRLQWLLNRITKINFWSACKIFIGGQAVTLIPGGEAARSFLIRKETNIPLIKTTGPIYMLGLTELVTAILTAAIISQFFNIFKLEIGIALIFLLLTLLGGLNLGKLNFITKVLSKYDWGKKFNQTLHRLEAEIKVSFFKKDNWIPRGSLVWSIVNSFITILISGYLMFYITSLFNADISYPQALFIISLAVVISLLDNLSPIGVGFSEGGIVGIFLSLGVSAPIGLASMLVYKVATLILGTVLGIIVVVLFYSFNILKGKNAT